jgi:heptose-I-phosphate ethanolaminephosphotransferase
MDSILELFFKIIPTKLFFISGVLYLWYKLQKNSPKEQKGIYRFAVASAIAASLLSLFSIQKLYPYGTLIDLVIILLVSASAIALAARFKTKSARFIAIATPLMTLSAFPLFYILHYNMVGGALNYDSLVAIFQSNTAEAGEYISSFTSIINIVIILSSMFLVSWLAYKFSISSSLEHTKSYNSPKACLILLVILIVIPKDKGLFSYPFLSFNSYLHELTLVRENRQKKIEGNSSDSFIATKKGNGETYIVVIGESLNKHHMGIYNDKKETSPELVKLKNNNDLIVFPKSYSNYPGTMAALSWALSTSNQYNKRDFVDSVGLVDVYNKAGFKTIWIGNQPISNSYDMLLGFIAKSSDEVVITFDIEFHGMSHDNHQPDGVLLPHINQALTNQGDENTIIFVHLMGNHTNYCERYPEEYEKYTMSFLEETWMRVIKGGLGHSETCYDNSVLYNDFIISSIIEQLKQSNNSQPAGLLYFADHSEDIVRGVGHSSANFSYDMIESPTIMWLSDNYKEQYPEKVTAINNNRNEIYSNDSIFDTAIGMSNIQLEAEHYCEHCDITNSLYELKPEDAYTMHGELKYVTKENPWVQDLLPKPEQHVSAQ